MATPTAATSLQFEANSENRFDAKTINLALLAGVEAGDRVDIEAIADKTLELFAKTLNLVELEQREAVQEAASPVHYLPSSFVPEHEDLRKRFLFAEALGGYSTLNDLIDSYSPGYKASVKYSDLLAHGPLQEHEVRNLEQYLCQLTDGLKNANSWLIQHAAGNFTNEELHELHQLLLAARDRANTVTSILGAHLICEIEQAVQILYGFHKKMRTVQRSVGGIFLVDSEVMFLPTNDLIKCVNTIFKGVGNPYLTEHIDGTILLAARNLLIEAVSFYSYYGKQRIYDLFKDGEITITKHTISMHIRQEIRKLFDACKENNKLILKRVMSNAEREFEISVEAIQREAERSAVEAVRQFLPEPPKPRTVRKRSLLRRMFSWLLR